MHTHLIISTANELLRVAASHIIYISSDGNYSNLLMSGGEIKMVTFQLGHIEEMIHKQLPEYKATFVRIGRSLIINGCLFAIAPKDLSSYTVPEE